MNNRYSNGLFNRKMMKIFLCGVNNLILNVLINVLVKVEFIMKFGIICNGLVVVKGIVFLVIKESFIIILVKLVFC